LSARSRLAKLALALYLPSIAGGLWGTLRHLLRVLRGRTETLQYPEERHVPPPGFRGEHYLKLDPQGRIKCVACFLCQTACPAECIHIEAAPAPWDEREKYPAVFNIDMLRCIYCGMCEEACPCDAIALSPKFYTVMTSRDQWVYTRDRLAANYPSEEYGPAPVSVAPVRVGDHV
jgi:NADH-quinone oxidoreductase subunit I